MKNWTLEVKLKVADSWVADGFDAAERIEQVKEMLSHLLPFAHEHELVIEVKVTKSPAPELVEALQNGDAEIKD